MPTPARTATTARITISSTRDRPRTAAGCDACMDTSDGMDRTMPWNIGPDHPYVITLDDIWILLSVAEVAELQRNVGNLLLHQRDRLLQRVALGAGDAHGLALDRRLHLELAVLDQTHDLLGRVLLDADTYLELLLDLVAADLLDLAVLETAHVD